MRLFFASQTTTLKYLKSIQPQHNILISYEYFNASCLPELIPMIEKYFIFDSGAFSVWKSGKEIDFHKYIEMCSKLYDVLGDKLIVINLDVIPASFGVKPTAKDIKYSCEQSFKNYLYMKKHLKCKIMPVFHQHDNFDYLHKYIEEEVFLLGISPANDMTTSQRKPWLNNCFKVTKDIQRCHGLAATSYDLMSTYPFYSCDSASWLLGAGFGNVWEWTGKEMKTVHYSQKDKVIKYQLFDIIDDRENKDIKYIERYKKNIKSYVDMGLYLNNLWIKRGVIWND